MPVSITESRLSHQEVSLGNQRVTYLSGFDNVARVSAVLGEHLAVHSSVLLLVDSGAEQHVWNLLKHLDGGLLITTLVVDTTERDKTLTTVHRILDNAIDAGVDRAGVVLAMGGGVLGNIAGMVAALLYRGLPLVHLPTTPVAAFDAVLSTKQAVNLARGKNLCGLYLTPSLIACDLSWLTTVPPGQLLAGFAEMAKNVLAVRPVDATRFCDALARYGTDPGSALTTLLDIGVQSKAPFLASDAKEKQDALVFEYGHTVGHALEFASEGRLSHGEAIAWGMLAAADVSAGLLALPAAEHEQHHQLVSALGLDRTRLSTLDPAAVKRLLDTDNKRGYLNTTSEFVPMVLLKSLGSPAILDGRPLVAAPRELVDLAVDTLLTA